MSRRNRWLALFFASTLAAACGKDPAPNPGVTCDPGTLCECTSDDDCPTGELCDPFTATCRADEGDVSADVVEDIGTDTPLPDVGVDTPDVGVDTPEIGVDTDLDVEIDVVEDPVNDPIEDPTADPISDPVEDVDTGLPPVDSVSNPWVAYLSNEITGGPEDAGLDKLFVVKLDGSFRQQIPTPEPAIVSSPAWSPDGTMIAAVTLNTSGRRLWLIDVETEVMEFRTIAGLSNWSDPWFSPDGTKIVIAGRATAADSSRIWIYDVADESLTPVTPEGANCASPYWHRSGRIWYTRSLSEQNADIFSVLPDGTEDQQETTGSRMLGAASIGAFEEVAFVVRRISAGAETSEIARIDLETGASTVLGDEFFSALTVSPDGRFLAATIDRVTDLDIVVLDTGNGAIQAEPVMRPSNETASVIGPVESDLIDINFRD